MQNQNHDLIFRVKRRLVEALDLEKRHIAGVRILNDNSANQSIATVILNGRSALISRFGSTEAEFCAEFIRGDTRLASTWKSSDNLWKLSGVFPKTNRQLSDFFNVYTGAAKEMDYCGVRCESVEFTYWRLEEECFSLFSSSSNPYNIEVLSAIFIDNPWTLALRGKRVVIIHPFAETIRSQLLRLRQMPS